MLEAHRRTAIENFQRVRPLYEGFARVIEDILDEALKVANIKAASIESRAKSLESFANKAAQGSEAAPETPKYSEPLTRFEAMIMLLLMRHSRPDIRTS